MNEPDLPPLSTSTHQVQGHPRPAFLLTRKRTRSDYDDEPATSSDPATFSSDEAAPGAENYASGKRKKHIFRGSWYDHHPVQDGIRIDRRQKREFRRNFDSGIFMGSESEEPLSSDSFTMEDEFLNDQANTTPRRSALLSAENMDITPKVKLVLQKMPTEHEGVCKVVRHCLEIGKEDVDLSAMALSSLPSEITTLNTLSKQDEIAPGMLHIGTSLEPRLRLFLGHNLLTRVPNPILDLRNLRFLSLRNNNLVSIPPGIRELVNLESLNLAGNQLTDLPVEILSLVREGHLQDLILHPNPWTRVEDKRGFINHSDVTGHIKNGSLRLWRIEGPNYVADALQPSPERQVVPSLTEFVLRHLAKIDPRGETDFADYMPPGSPQAVLNHLSFLKEHPGRRCASCSRPIVLAAAGLCQTEWWHVSNGLLDIEIHLGPPAQRIPFQRYLCWKGCQELRD